MANEMTGSEMIRQMREVLQPKGTADLVGLRLDSACYVRSAFVTECINEIENIALMAEALGEPATALQKLGIMVLKESAYIK